MSRTAGTGLMGLGVVLGVVGAIMRFAVKVHTEGFNVHNAGIILLVVGALVFVVSLLIVLLSGRTRSTMREDIRATPGGQERIQERDDWAATP